MGIDEVPPEDGVPEGGVGTGLGWGVGCKAGCHGGVGVPPGPDVGPGVGGHAGFGGVADTGRFSLTSVSKASFA